MGTTSRGQGVNVWGGGQGWVWGSPCSISVREGRGGEGRAGTEEGPCTYTGGGEVHIRL